MNGLRLAANLSILWPDIPYEERFQRAASAGFRAVETWWPGPQEAEKLVKHVQRYEVQLALLNFDAGDLSAGDRGLVSDPAQLDQFRANVPFALEVAEACGCHRLNALLGLRLPEYSAEDQLRWARENVGWAAEQASAQGAYVMIEPLSVHDNGPYLVPRTEEAANFIESVGQPNVRLQYDVFQAQRMEGNLATTIERHWNLIDHIQIADVPGRHEPGTGEINFAFLFSFLAQKGYRGFIGVEYHPSTGDVDASLSWRSLLKEAA